ncbi:MAG: hypothetical protein ACRDMH_18600, partial [Solirubrobacterales bacterium]
PSPAPRARQAARADGRPPAPWGTFPLVELVVLCGLILLIAGFVVGGLQGTTMIGVGLALGALAGLEVSLREHFAGYRSHTILLAGAVGVGVLVALALLVPSLWFPIALAVAVAVFAITAWALARAFRRRSGLAFKVR